MNNSNSGTDATFHEAMRIVNWVVLVITLPAILLAIYVMYRQMRLKHAVHVYIINLFISDILQFIDHFGWYLTRSSVFIIFVYILYFSVILNVGFLMCIAMERYLMIAHPHWYSVHCTVKCSILTSLGVWVVSLMVSAQLFLAHFLPVMRVSIFIYCAFLLLPFPLLPFLFVGTWRGLSKAFTVSTREKRRILATLGLVIGSYTLFFLPFIIVVLFSVFVSNPFITLADLFLCMNPLSDLLLYIFVRNDTRRILEDIPCCRRSQTDREETDHTAVTSL